MKSLTFFACMIGMLLVTSVALGEIVYTDDWDSDEEGNYEYAEATCVYTEADVIANQYYPSSWADVDAWRNYSLTENCTCDWEKFLWTYARVDATRNDSYPHSARAYSYGLVSGQPFDPNYSSVEVELDEDTDPENNTPSTAQYGGYFDADGTNYFTAGTAIYSYHHIEVEADITVDSTNQTSAFAWAHAYCYLEENNP